MTEVKTVVVLFSNDELWLLQSVVRHEVAQRDHWRFPPASLDLNDQIAEALHRCKVLNSSDAALQLSRGDLLVIDYCVPANAKDHQGRATGKNILLKSFEARVDLQSELQDAADVPLQLSKDAVKQRLAERPPAEGEHEPCP